MAHPEEDIHQLVLEHGVLLRYCGTLQGRCTEHTRTHEQEIERLYAEVMCLRAQVIARDSALHWEREERLKLQDTLNKWLQVGAVIDREDAAPVQAPSTADIDPGTLEHSLHAADLVICQTGCVTHGSFWRVEDHCKRMGKTCVLVEEPDALRIVRVHSSGRTEQLATASWQPKEATS